MKPVITPCCSALAACLMLLASALANQSDSSSDNYQALLAAESEQFRQATGGHPLSFPADHGAHPDYRLEWWYVTANLEDAEGNWYGAQWTLFRSGLSGQAAVAEQAQVYMAHAALSWQGGHHAMEKYARSIAGQAGVTSQPFAAWIDHWQMRSSEVDSWLPLKLHASDEHIAMDLTLASEQPLVLQGDQGFSVKNLNGSGSYYYSQPYLQVSGNLKVAGQQELVAVKGQAWLDREWSSQFLLPEQQGWDWLALHLNNGEKVMVYQLRSKPSSGLADYKWLSWFDSRGQRKLYTQAFELISLNRVNVAGRDIPQQWQITHSPTGLSLIATTRQANQWMDVDYPYWEGPVLVSGSHQGQGYLEMTGYPEQ